MAKVSAILIIVTVLAIMTFAGEAMAIASAFFIVFIVLALTLFRGQKRSQFPEDEDQQREEQEDYQANAYDWGRLEGYYKGYRDRYDHEVHWYEAPLFRYEYPHKSAYGRGHRRGYYEGYQDSYDCRTHRYEGINYYQNHLEDTIKTGATDRITPRKTLKSSTRTMAG
jgi:hypothetical protein